MTDRNGTLQVRGAGRVRVAPDEAIVHLGVMTEGRTAAEATQSNAKRTEAVIGAVSAQPNHGVTTMGLGVSPVITYDPHTGVGKIVGFRATNGVEVKAKVSQAGPIYDAGVGAGANESSGITFRVKDEAPYREEALRIAVQEAHREAQIVAKATGVELKGLESIQIEPSGGRVFYRSEAIASKSTPMPVIPEEATLSAVVQIVFRTRD